MESKYYFWAGVLTAFAGTVASIGSFARDYPEAGYVLSAIAVLGVGLAGIPHVRLASARCKRLYHALMRLSEASVKDQHELRDREKFARLESNIADVCSKLDATLADTRVDKNFSTNFLFIRLTRAVLGETVHLFQEYTGQSVVAYIQGISGSATDQAEMLVLMPSMPHSRRSSQPTRVPKKGTVIEQVLDTGVGQIVEEVKTLKRDDVWADRPNFVKSMIAWPIKVGANTALVLKIDSAVPGAFHDTSSTRILADICARKIATILQLRRVLDALQSMGDPRETELVEVEAHIDSTPVPRKNSK